MGYYTRFELEILKNNDRVTDHEDEISKLADYDNCFGNRIGWYDWEEDMKEYSKKHPNTLFKLSGIGEEFPDAWEAYFRNGKMQLCEAVVTYPPFDESKLE